MACAGPSLNMLISSLVWRQDHNGFRTRILGFWTSYQQEPRGDAHLSAARCKLPASVTDHCLRSRDYVNVIVADKQDHLSLSRHGSGGEALHQGHRDLGLAEHGRGQ